MSEVTNVIICCSSLENTDDIISDYRNYIHNGHPFHIVAIDDEKLPKGWYGGEKYLECNVFIGAYNTLDLDKFLKFTRERISWEALDLVQVLVKEEHDERFRLFEF